jgi:hypothetical protein
MMIGAVGKVSQRGLGVGQGDCFKSQGQVRLLRRGLQIPGYPFAATR